MSWGGGVSIRVSKETFLPLNVQLTEDMCQKQLTNIEVAGSQSGFPKKPFSPLMSNRFSVSSMNMLKTIYQRCVMRMKVNAMDVRMRLGDAIDPCHLANGFEAVIGYECQERSNPPFSHPHDTYNTCKV